MLIVILLCRHLVLLAVLAVFAHITPAVDARYSVAGALCSVNEVTINPGDLNTAIKTHGYDMTYILTPGAYTVSQSIRLFNSSNPDNRIGGICIIGQNGNRQSVTISPVASPAAGAFDPFVQMFHLGPKFPVKPPLPFNVGFKDVTFDGQGRVGCNRIHSASAIGVDNCIYRGCVATSNSNDADKVGAGMFVAYTGYTMIKNSEFRNCYTLQHGGALDFLGKNTVEVRDVSIPIADVNSLLQNLC